MKRIIEFNFKEEKYFLSENGECIFSIPASDLKFNSVDFYNGVYKNKSIDIELENKIVSDPNKKGDYIFSWLSEIISYIRNEFPEEVSTDEESVDEEFSEEESTSIRIIPLFDFAACAGDGFFIDESVPHEETTDYTGIADYAVTVSGDSMEPTVKNKSMIFIKKEAAPEHNEVGLFVVDGEVMCKRYIKQGRGYKLVPDNKKHKTYTGKEISTITYLGKVILDN